MENEYISSDISERIKKRLKEFGVTAEQMLSELEMGKRTLQNYKTSMPKADNLAYIADYLDCSVDYLLGRTDNPNISGNYINGDNSVQAIRNGNGNMTINTGNKSEKENNCKEIEVLLKKMPRSKQLRAIADIIDLLEEKYQEE